MTNHNDEILLDSTRRTLAVKDARREVTDSPFPPPPRVPASPAPEPHQYISGEMRAVKASMRPVAPDVMIAALQAEVNAVHAKLGEVSDHQAQLSASDLTQSKDIAAVIREVRALAPSNNAGAAKALEAAQAAEQAKEGLGKLDAKAWVTLVVTVIGALIGLIRALKGDPPPVPVVVTPATSYVAPDAGGAR